MKEIDWNQVTINASIAALQGIVEAKGGVVFELDPTIAAGLAVDMGEALCRRLRKKLEVPSEPTENSEETTI